MEYVVAYVAYFVISLVVFAIGFWRGRKYERAKTQTLGTLQIDHSDPDMPYLFLLDYDLDYIATKKQATFEVKVEDLVSHK